MYATAFAILRNSEDASDVTQDLIMSLWQKHDEIQIPDNPQAFCVSMTRNHCIDRLRRDSKRFFENIDSLYMMASDVEADSAISLTTTQSCISDILMRFKEKHRRVMILSLFSQLSNDEISVITGESTDNIRAILSRGRKKIKEYLSNEQ
ncbi:MAG: sigma-70 family RNA polymerase sigma factor [Paramuribaculum sp.]|nr:sigma-70 family RNA polymerase sigma factor [Paramuribaculum sp.]